MNEQLKGQPGVTRTYSGAYVNIIDPDPDTLFMHDIAWHLGRILRYNGGIRQDYTVAHHSLIMSYAVPEEYALEALLHDAAEAYMGDIVWPVKSMYPELEEDEARLAGEIMLKFAFPQDWMDLWVDGNTHDEPKYHKSPTIAAADHQLYLHECFSFGDRPGVYHDGMQLAWGKAIANSGDLWVGPMYPFMFRYHELIGSGVTPQELIDNLEVLWYKERGPEYSGLTDEQAMSLVVAQEELE
jgi:hypothetical protein